MRSTPSRSTLLPARFPLGQRLRAARLALASRVVPRFARGPGFLEDLESRVLLSVTPATASTADQEVRADGSFVYIGQKNMRVGGGTTGLDSDGVFPFLLPSIPTGQYLANASLTVNL